MLFVDALSYDYINDVDMPEMSDLARTGVLKKVKSVPLHSWPDMVFTGCYPEKNNIATAYKYSPSESPFATLSPHVKWLDAVDRAVKRLPVAGKLFRRGVNEALKAVHRDRSINIAGAPFDLLPHFASSYKRRPCDPGAFANKSVFDVLGENNIRFMWDRFSPNQMNLTNRIHNWIGVGTLEHIRSRVLRRNPFDAQRYLIKVIQEGAHQFVFCSLGQLDWFVHREGLYNDAVRRKLREVDMFVGTVCSALKQRGGRYCLTICSDHGMNEVVGSVNILSILKQNHLLAHREFVPWVDSESIRIWTEDDTVKQKILSVLASIPQGRVLNKKDLEAHHLSCRREQAGDILFLMKPGWIILPNYFQLSTKCSIKAMHGYEPNNAKYSCPMVLVKGNQSSYESNGRAEHVDIAPTILEYFKLGFAHSIDGSALASV